MYRFPTADEHDRLFPNASEKQKVSYRKMTADAKQPRLTKLEKAKIMSKKENISLEAAIALLDK